MNSNACKNCKQTIDPNRSSPIRYCSYFCKSVDLHFSLADFTVGVQDGANHKEKRSMSNLYLEGYEVGKYYSACKEYSHREADLSKDDSEEYPTEWAGIHDA